MNRDDFVKLVGAAHDKTHYLPVAFLLRNGYACAGYYYPAVNEDLTSTCVLLNARLIELQNNANKIAGEPNINDFNDFLEDVVVEYCSSTPIGASTTRGEVYGKSIPLTAIPYDQIAVVYPVAHIGALMRRAEEHQKIENQRSEQPQKSRLPTFLDLNKSEVVQLLRTKLW